MKGTWHLVAKDKSGVKIWDVRKFNLIGEAWDFIKQMKTTLLITEIIWTIHNEKTGSIIDTPVHLHLIDDKWVRHDIAEWNREKE